MNWIKSNPFVSGLAAITVVVCGLLYLLASKGGTKYEDAKTSFDEAFAKVSTAEGIPLYPKAENRDAKRKALNEYRESVENLRDLFKPFRPEKLDQISPQDFTVHLKNATEETSKALEEAGCELPKGFFMGFEKYRDLLAQTGSTGILDFQVAGMKHALMSLAEARPSKLIKIYRDALPEEAGTAFQAEPNDVARDLGIEFTFQGSEDAARKFISALGETNPYYYVVRCVKIQNERGTPPKVADAKFELPKPAAAVDENNPFGGAFVLPGGEEEEPAAAEEKPAGEKPAGGKPDAEKEAPAPAEAAAEIDSTRILAQVLGSEEVIVFVRFDLTMFLASKELPKP